MMCFFTQVTDTWYTEQKKDEITEINFGRYRVCAGDVIKAKSKTKEPLKVLSSSGLRGSKFIPVYNVPAQ